MITTIKSGDTSCYILSNKTVEGYILVDAGTMRDKNFTDKLKATGESSKIGLPILTHGHYDHVGYASFLHGNFNIPTATHHKDNDKVSCDFMDFPPVKGFLSNIIRNLTIRDNQTATYPRFEPDIVLDSSLQTEGPPEVEILCLSEYTQGPIDVIFESNLLAGDLVASMFLPSTTWFTEDFSLVRKSVHSVYGTSFVWVYPGHRNSFPSGLLKKLL